jgi:hypothetical protein
MSAATSGRPALHEYTFLAWADDPGLDGGREGRRGRPASLAERLAPARERFEEKYGRPPTLALVRTVDDGGGLDLAVEASPRVGAREVWLGAVLAVGGPAPATPPAAERPTRRRTSRATAEPAAAPPAAPAPARPTPAIEPAVAAKPDVGPARAATRARRAALATTAEPGRAGRRPSPGGRKRAGSAPGAPAARARVTSRPPVQAAAGVAAGVVATSAPRRPRTRATEAVTPEPAARPAAARQLALALPGARRRPTRAPAARASGVVGGGGVKRG